MQNYSSAQNKSWYWATELKKIWGVKKPPLLCSKHLTKITDVHSPETILAAPSPVLQTPTELSTPFRSISLHKAHKLLRSEIHSEKLHFRLDLSDQRHTHADQHTDEGSTPVITTRWWITKSTESSDEEAEFLKQEQREAYGLGMAGCTNHKCTLTNPTCNVSCIKQ